MSISTDNTPIDEVRTAYEEFLKQRDSPPLFSQRKIIGEFFSFLGMDGDFSLMPPHPDSPIEEIDAYLTEKNRELYQRLADGDSEQDAPITPEFLEGLGFVVHNLVPYGTRCLEFGNAYKAIQVWFDSEDMRIVKYGALDSYAEVGHIRTQSQLTSLVAALFGGGDE